MDSGIGRGRRNGDREGQPSEPDERLADFPAAAGDFDDRSSSMKQECGQPPEPDERLADVPAAAGDFDDWVGLDEPVSFDDPLLLDDDGLDDEPPASPEDEPLDDEVSEDASAVELALLDESDDARASLSADFFFLPPLASARESLR